MMSLARIRLDSPVGPLLAIASEHGLCGLPFLDPRDEDGDVARFAARLRKWFGGTDASPLPVVVDEARHPVLVQTRGWLEDYFAGICDRRQMPQLDLRGGAFEQAVWRALLEIPIGTTTSYGEVAKRIGSPGAARAVGLANGANPLPIIVPCHRVIGASGALTGYGGGLPRKTWLLDHERRHWGTERTFDFT
jgi:O-6-methylguanine DNA methyltransferase